MRLAEPIEMTGRTASSRVVFGPHPTNLGRGRTISDGHVAYYERRAAGGAGVIVTETASVGLDDWPYERAPLARECEPGWAAVAAACRPHGSLLLAGIGHSGGQGSSAYSQSALWAPSRVPDAASRELPAEMEQPQIDTLVAGFADAADRAASAGLDGVEVDAGALALLRQFHSGISNQRTDAYGEDKLRLTREVLAAVRARFGGEHVLGLRLSCDELAPWAGVTPEHAAEQVRALSELVDVLTVVRGGPYSVSAYRPDAHTAPVFNRELCARMREAAAAGTLVVLQGSVVDTAEAQAALDDGVADLVEMTRAQIADPDLVAWLRAGHPERARPCILCNQACQVRDARNPIVSCVGEPRSGHETEEREPNGAEASPRDFLVVGGGPAGLECARVAAGRGHRVRLAERSARFGGVLRAAATGPGRERLALLTDWLEAECRRAGVDLATRTEVGSDDVDAAEAAGSSVVLATGSRPAERRYAPAVPGADVADAEGHPGPDAPHRTDPNNVLSALDVLIDGLAKVAAEPVLVYDPVGGPVAVGMAEWLAGAGYEVVFVTPDQIAGTLLSLTGDLADANTRLQQAGVRRELRVLLREISSGRAVLQDVWTGERRTVPCGTVIDCGHRLPDEALYLAGPGTARAGDCVAPRTVLEAVLEGRRCAQELDAGERRTRPVGASN